MAGWNFISYKRCSSLYVIAEEDIDINGLLHLSNALLITSKDLPKV